MLCASVPSVPASNESHFMDMALPSDMCRLCASDGNFCISIFGEDGNRILLKQKLRICSPVIVKETDLLPKQVCLPCLSSIDQTYDFYQKAKVAQLKLKALIDLGPGKKRRQLDSDNADNVKRIRFASTILTYPAELHDKLNMPNDGSEKNTVQPPLFVVMGEKPEGNKDKSEDNGTVAPNTNSAPSKPAVALQANTTNISHSRCDTDFKEEYPSIKVSVPNTPEKSRTKGVTPKLSKVKQEPVAPVKTAESSEGEASPKPVSRTKNSQQNQVVQSSKPSPKKSLSLSSRGVGDCSRNKEYDGYEQCRHCERKFAPNLLAQHEAIHMGKNLYFCDQCDVNFFHEAAFLKHVHRRHELTKTNSTEQLNQCK